MRPNRLNEIKAKQADENAEVAEESEKAAEPAKQARKTRLDLIKAKQAEKSGDEPAVKKAVSRLSKLDLIKAEQAEKGADLTAAPANTSSNLSALFEQLKAAIETDIARIKTHKNVADKLACKAELLPSYLPFVEDYVTNGHNYPNSVAVEVMIWLFDTAQVEQALSLALYLIDTGKQNMPKRFSSDIEAFICHELYNWAKEQLNDDQSASPYLDTLVATAIDKKWDLHPAVISQVVVMLAKHKNRQGDFRVVIELCDLAEKVNPEKAGVKTLRKNAEAQLTK